MYTVYTVCVYIYIYIYMHVYTYIHNTVYYLFASHITVFPSMCSVTMGNKHLSSLMFPIVRSL